MKPDASTLDVEEHGGQTPTVREPASLAMVMESCRERIYDVITQKFCEGASIEEIARDWNIETTECVPVPRLILEVFRYHLIQSHWRNLQHDA